MSKHQRLFALLTIATFFEGFDTRLVSLVQPVIGREFGASKEELGFVLGLSSLGMVFAFFGVHAADRVGRRPVFLAALAAYALLTLATAFAPSLTVFTLLQVFARMAMVVELGLAYLILSEEMPPEVRGRVNGLFGGCVALGASVPDALLHPLTNLGVGWRGLFLIGAVPLLLFPLYVLQLGETEAFRARRALAQAAGGSGAGGGGVGGEARTGSGATAGGAPSPGFGQKLAEELGRLRVLLSSVHRARVAGITALWVIVNFWSGTALYSFTLYVFDERGWTPADLVLLPLGTVPCGLLGYSLAGLAMDRLGRRRASSLYLAIGVAATLTCYQASASAAILAGYFALIGLGGVWAIVTTWTAELFPTELRATATGFANNLVGRFGLVFGPMVAGVLGGALGSTADAVAWLGLVPLFGIPIALALPETNAIRLSPTDGRA
ncbi:MAG: MFS transporter [Myxococcota bacterium]